MPRPSLDLAFAGVIAIVGLAACSAPEREFGPGTGGAGGGSTSTSSDAPSSSSGAVDPVDNGEPCFAPAECASGFCVDGVCCDAACTGGCMACAALYTGGPNGTCAPAKLGTDPHNKCAPDSPLGCKQDGSCDGEGACGYYATGTECGKSTCDPGTGTKTPVSVCDGSGTCVAPSVLVCANGCNNDASGCAEDCSADSCDAGSYCDQASGSCVAKSANGGACTSGDTCASGHCVDGVCCDTACEGKCQACTVAKRGFGEDGACGSIKAGEDPDSECEAEAPSTCGYDGACDGAGSCRKYVAGTKCGGGGYCVGTTFYPPDTCSSSGGCQSKLPKDCGAMGCSPSGCGAVR